MIVYKGLYEFSVPRRVRWSSENCLECYMETDPSGRENRRNDLKKLSYPPRRAD